WSAGARQSPSPSAAVHAQSRQAQAAEGSRAVASSIRRDCVEFLDPVAGLPPRPAFAVEEGRRDASVGQQFGSAHDSLMNVDRGCADLFDDTDNLQIAAETGRAAIFDVDLDDRIGASGRSKLRRLVDSDGADEVRARPLHEFQI